MGSAQTECGKTVPAASFSAVFGFQATLLAVIGLSGVMAYTLAQRTREVGIRIALGAARVNVIWMVMREALLLVPIGGAAGVTARSRSG